MTGGWIKIWRSLLDWEWADVPEMVALWVHLLLRCTHDDTSWHGITVKRGQMVTTVAKLAAQVGMTPQQTRTCLERLENSKQITRQSTNKYTIITICKYDTYQDAETTEQQTKTHTNNEPSTSEATNQASNQQQHNKKIRRQEDNNTPLPPKGGVPPAARAVTVFDRAFERIYREKTGDAFAWSKRENVAVQTIVGKIVKIVEDGGGTLTDTEKMENFTAFISAVYDRGDEWMRSNFTPHVIADKFNEYYQHLKNQKNGKSTNATGVSADYLARVARELNG